LGWPPRDAWDTPIIEILTAWEAKLDFLKKTNPWGQAEEKVDKKAVAKEVRMGFRVAAMSRKQ
jgi:hypothetical protein